MQHTKGLDIYCQIALKKNSENLGGGGVERTRRII